MRSMTIIAACAALWLGMSVGVSAGDTVADKAGAVAAKSSVERCSRSCRVRVHRRDVREKWRREARRYGLGLLHARMMCESGSSGGYRLATTGNGYWFAFQFDRGAWTGAGGRVRGGRPVGVWTVQPTRAEQRYRAVRWDRIHGGDAWPNCP